MEILPENWTEIFAFETPLLELFARAAVLYGAVLVFMRVLPRRTGGEAAHMDLIFMLLIAEAAAHSLGDYTSVADGLVVILTILGLNYLLNLLSFYFPVIENLVSHNAIQVVRDGQLDKDHMRREFLTEGELMSFLRQNGIDDLSKVRVAMVEGKGKISVIKAEE
jgi:uncharacterized membrane protein YcaP (DUF421 family)